MSFQGSVSDAVKGMKSTTEKMKDSMSNDQLSRQYGISKDEISKRAEAASKPRSVKMGERTFQVESTTHTLAKTKDGLPESIARHRRTQLNNAKAQYKSLRIAMVVAGFTFLGMSWWNIVRPVVEELNLIRRTNEYRQKQIHDPSRKRLDEELSRTGEKSKTW